jgi:hypothetical protein
MGCVIKITIYTKLLYRTLIPLLIGGLLVGTWRYNLRSLEQLERREESDHVISQKRKRQVQMLDVFKEIVFLMIFLIYPGMAR